MGQGMVISFIVTLVVSLIALAWYCARYSAYSSWEGRAALCKRWLGPAGIATILLAACVVIATSAWLQLLGARVLPDQYAEYASVAGNEIGYPLWYIVFGVCLLSPLCEEVVCRGVVLNAALRAGAPSVVAIIAQAALFGILHATAFQVLYAFFVGLLLGWICLKTRSTVPTILIHIVNNVVGMLMFAYPGILGTCVIVVCVLGALLGVVLYLRGVVSLEPAPVDKANASR